MRPLSVSSYVVATTASIDRDLVYDVLVNGLGLPFSVHGAVDHFVIRLPGSSDLHLQPETDEDASWLPTGAFERWQTILGKAVGEVWTISFPDAAADDAVPVMSRIVSGLISQSGGLLWDLQRNVLVWHARRRRLFPR